MIALLFALLVSPPRDTVLTEILLVSTSQRMVVEAIEDDSTLLLPSAALHDLLGAAFSVPWVSLEQLRRAYPTLIVRWSPEMNQVAVWDELHVLPATRKFYETTRASAMGAVPLPMFSGPYGAVAVDDQRRALLDLGYLYRGRLSVAGRVDDRGIGQWNVSAAPWSRLFLGANGGTRQATSVSSRVQAGPVWVSATYAEHRSLEVAGLVRGGPVLVFASRQYGVLTWQGSLWSAQIARTWTTGRTVGRISWGPVSASPFALPLTTLR